MYVPTSRGSPKSPGQRLQGASQICLMSWLTRGLGQVPHVTRKLQSLGLRRKILESARAIGLYSDARKRAFRRARRRAERCGGTMYRGRWHTARELGAGGNDGPAGDTGARRSGRRPIGRDLPWTAQPRQRVRSYNVGGITSDVYAVLHRWLTQESQDDIVILQVCTGDVGNRTAAGRYQAGL